ncbi:YegS/Rv2252/BmrU family lipid kinase [Nocardioides coralli]|nr:YegS/Rv2252/BmrU family lipid kinase [Nocardioides coralli]
MITNEGAGTADEASLKCAVDLLSEHTSVEVVATSNPGELDSVLHRAGGRRIVVAGGDGSLHAVVAALHRRRDLASAVLGLIPLGTGNDFARAMDVPLDPEEAAALLVTGDVRPVDMLVDERGGVVVNNVHVGAGAQASRRGDRWKQRLGQVGYKKVNLGRLGYPIGALLAAVKPPQVRLRVEVDGRVVCDVDEPVLMVAVGNGTSVGGGTELTPEADAEDGLVDVMISRSVGPLAKLGYVAQMARSRHHERDDVEYLRAREVTVSGEDFWCAADGEISGPERRRSWRVEPAAYSMVLP